MASTRAPYRKLTRTGSGSYYVVIPPDLIRRLGWRERQRLAIKQKGRALVIRDWKG